MLSLETRILLKKRVTFIFLGLILCSCSLLPKNKNDYEKLGLVKYEADPYELTSNDPDPLTDQRRTFCIERLKDLKYSFYNLFYKSDGLKVKAVVALPPHFSPEEKHPLLVFNRGGNRNFGYFTVCDIKMLSDFAATVPNAVVVTAQLRGSHESEGEDEFGGKDVNDITNLIDLFERQSFIDSSQKYLVGWSRGGMMAYLLLKKQISFKAAAVIAGPTNLFLLEEERPQMAQIHSELIPNYETNRQVELKNRSVLYWPEKINSPLIVIQGTKDWRVPVQHGRLIREHLTRQKKNFLYKEYEGQDHDLRGVYSEMITEIKKWFQKFEN